MCAVLQPKLQAQQGECGSSPSARSRSTLQAELRLLHSTHSTLNSPTCTLVPLQPVWLICTIQFQCIMCIYSELCSPVVLLQLSGQDGSCDDSVTSSNFNRRRKLPVLDNSFFFERAILLSAENWLPLMTADEIRTFWSFYTLSPPLELC